MNTQPQKSRLLLFFCAALLYVGIVPQAVAIYDPTLGRWLSRDPIGEEGGINLYGYVEGQVIGVIDPVGYQGIGDPASMNEWFGQPENQDATWGGRRGKRLPQQAAQIVSDTTKDGVITIAASMIPLDRAISWLGDLLATARTGVGPLTREIIKKCAEVAPEARKDFLRQALQELEKANPGFRFGEVTLEGGAGTAFLGQGPLTSTSTRAVIVTPTGAIINGNAANLLRRGSGGKLYVNPNPIR